MEFQTTDNIMAQASSFQWISIPSSTDMIFTLSLPTYLFLTFLKLFVAFADDSCNDSIALLQPARSNMQRTWARDWRSSRDLANVTDIKVLPIPGSSAHLLFTSAVPVFGPTASYIALMHIFSNYNPVEYLYNKGGLSLFCSGPNKSHQTKVRVVGNETETAYKRHLVFFCDWPEEEKHLDRFEVFLDDGDGNHIGSVVAEQKSGLLQQYRTAACVRDVYPNEISGLRLLPQWLEFHLQHGVEHFIIYTVNLDSKTLVSLWEPYIKSGVATRVHFDKSFFGRSHNLWMEHMMQDCLFRFKNHAEWVLPHTDIDEFFLIKDGSLFEGGQVPDDYLRTTWDAVVASKGYQTNEIHSIHFPLYRFDIADPGQIELSSVLREPGLQQMNPKYAVNVKVANAIFTHWVTSWEEGAQGLSLSADIGVAHHYRQRHDYAILGNITANTTDTSMLQYVPRLSEGLARRFGEKTTQLLTRLNAEKEVRSQNLLWVNEELQVLQEPKILAWMRSFNERRGIGLLDPPSESP